MSTNASRAAIVDDVMVSRRAVRAFLPDEVPADMIRAIFEAARWAPSGSNTQPWKVYVLRGQAKERLSSELLAVYDDPLLRANETEAYPTIQRHGNLPSWNGAGRLAGICTGFSASNEKTSMACMLSWDAISVSSMRQWP